MEDTKFNFWQKWLTYANLMTVLVGFLVAFAGNSFFFEAHNTGTRNVYLAGAAFPENILLMKNWLFGIIGGTIVGFHLLMVMISENAFKRKEKWAYQACWLGMISWSCWILFLSV